MSQYRIVINHVDGDRVTLKPGSHGERDLIEFITERFTAELADVLVRLVLDKGVGYMRSEARVEQAIRDSFSDALLKKAMQQSLDALFFRMKAEVLPVRDEQ